MDIFERAARTQLRFQTSSGILMVEDLFGMHLTHPSKPNLDKLAQQVHSELQSVGAVSFVDDKPSPQKTELTLKLDILKYIIESKKRDIVAAENRSKKAELRKQIAEAMEAKKGDALKSMSLEELQAKLAELEG